MATLAQGASGPAATAEIVGVDWAYLDGEFVPFGSATVHVAAHALNYGTGVFEGIRAYWNESQEQLYLFRAREHYERMAASCRILRIALPASPAELVEVTRELLRRNGHRADVYVRPLAFKAGRVLKVALEGIRDGFALYSFPVGAYLPVDGLRAAVASWRRVADNAIPARGKLTGAYINTALATDEANRHGADEGIFLTEDGHVSEGGGSNLFLVRDGVVSTPPVTADILEGITRDTVRTLLHEDLGLALVERAIDRTELYVADEIFFAGTGAQVAHCVTVDGRRVGRGTIGPITRAVSERYFAIARGADNRHAEWRVPVYA